MRRLTLGVVAVGLAMGAFALPARAQSDDDKSTARSLGQDGQDALDKKDFAKASDLFRRAVKIFDDAKAPVPPTLLLGFARASAGKGTVIASQEAYNRIIRQGTPPGAPALFVAAVEDAKKEIDAVSNRIASVTINVSGCDSPQVTIDDNAVSSAVLGVKKPVDPGAHIVKATAASCSSGEQSFEVADGKTAEVTIKLKKDETPTNTTPTTSTAAPTTTTPAATTTPPAPETPKSSSPNVPLAIGSFAVGGAGVILGAVTGVLALGKHSSLSDACPTGTNCPQSLSSDLGTYHTMGTLSTVGFIVGGVGVAAGIVFLVMAPKTEKHTAWIMPSIGPASVGAVGQF